MSQYSTSIIPHGIILGVAAQQLGYILESLGCVLMLSNLSVRQFNDQLRPDHTDYHLRLPFHGLTGPDPGISQS